MNFGTNPEKLRQVFTEYLYPGLVLGFFLFLLIYIFVIALDANGDSRVRRFTAAILPFLVLIFVLLPVDGKSLGYPRIKGITPLGQFISGALVAIVILQLGRMLRRFDAEIAVVTYILFISLIDTYMLYSMIENSLGDLHFLLFGMLVGGGFYVILLGTPVFSEKREQGNDAREDHAQFGRASRARPNSRGVRTSRTADAIPVSDLKAAKDAEPSESQKDTALRSTLDDKL